MLLKRFLILALLLTLAPIKFIIAADSVSGIKITAGVKNPGTNENEAGWDEK